MHSSRRPSQLRQTVSSIVGLCHWATTAAHYWLPNASAKAPFAVFRCLSPCVSSLCLTFSLCLFASVQHCCRSSFFQLLPLFFAFYTFTAATATFIKLTRIVLIQLITTIIRWRATCSQTLTDSSEATERLREVEQFTSSNSAGLGQQQSLGCEGDVRVRQRAAFQGASRLVRITFRSGGRVEIYLFAVALPGSPSPH